MKGDDYRQARAREIVEDAIAQLMDLGIEADGAAKLLVVQGAIRIKDREKRKQAASFVAEVAEDPIDEE